MQKVINSKYGLTDYSSYKVVKFNLPATLVKGVWTDVVVDLGTDWANYRCMQFPASWNGFGASGTAQNNIMFAPGGARWSSDGVNAIDDNPLTTLDGEYVYAPRPLTAPATSASGAAPTYPWSNNNNVAGTNNSSSSSGLIAFSLNAVLYSTNPNIVLRNRYIILPFCNYNAADVTGMDCQSTTTKLLTLMLHNFS